MELTPPKKKSPVSPAKPKKPPKKSETPVQKKPSRPTLSATVTATPKKDKVHKPKERRKEPVKVIPEKVLKPPVTHSIDSEVRSPHFLLKFVTLHHFDFKY